MNQLNKVFIIKMNKKPYCYKQKPALFYGTEVILASRWIITTV